MSNSEITFRVLGVAILILVPLAWGLGVDWAFFKIKRKPKAAVRGDGK